MLQKKFFFGASKCIFSCTAQRKRWLVVELNARFTLKHIVMFLHPISEAFGNDNCELVWCSVSVFFHVVFVNLLPCKCPVVNFAKFLL